MILTRHPFMAVTKPFGIDLNDPNLVLYLPLWSLKLSGTPFVSLDLNHHSCSVVGATQTPNGRLFAGDDDVIAHTAANWRSADALGTIAVWAKASATGYLLATADTASDNYYIGCYILAGTGLSITQKNNDTADSIKGDTDVADGTWHLCWFMSSGTAWTTAVDDGAVDTISVGAGSNTGDWFADTTNRDNLTIGALQRSGALEAPLTGTVGEVIVFKTATNLALRQYIYRVTKGRYL